MGFQYLFTPVDRSEYPDDANIPMFPGMYLAGHVALKGIHVGSFVGVAASPLLWKVTGSSLPVHEFMSVCAVNGAKIGAPVALLMLGKAIIHKGMDQGAMDDRAYRIRANNVLDEQNTYSAVGAIAGGLTAMYYGTSEGPALFKAALTGNAVAIGCYAAVKLTNNALARHK